MVVPLPLPNPSQAGLDCSQNHLVWNRSLRLSPDNNPVLPSPPLNTSLSATSTRLLNPCRGGDLPLCAVLPEVHHCCPPRGFVCLWLCFWVLVLAASPSSAGPTPVLSARSSHLVSITPPSPGWSLSEARKATLLLKEAELRCLFQAGDKVLCLCAAALMFSLGNTI